MQKGHRDPNLKSRNRVAITALVAFTIEKGQATKDTRKKNRNFFKLPDRDEATVQ